VSFHNALTMAYSVSSWFPRLDRRVESALKQYLNKSKTMLSVHRVAEERSNIT